ncbi:Protein Son [Manis pentadactyla]|nr:Protein Son [Manis pentadactyla]
MDDRILLERERDSEMLGSFERDREREMKGSFEEKRGHERERVGEMLGSIGEEDASATVRKEREREERKC